VPAATKATPLAGVLPPRTVTIDHVAPVLSCTHEWRRSTMTPRILAMSLERREQDKRVQVL